MSEWLVLLIALYLTQRAYYGQVPEGEIEVFIEWTDPRDAYVYVGPPTSMW